MKIRMEKRKGGIYAQWYEILTKCPNGRLARCLIYQHQANTYAKAVKYFNDHWLTKGYVGIELRNAAPYSNSLALAC